MKLGYNLKALLKNMFKVTFDDETNLFIAFYSIKCNLNAYKLSKKQEN